MSEFIADLSLREAKIIESIFSSVLTDQEQRAEPKLIREIIPIRDWVNSSYYVGPDQDLIYPFWKDALVRCV